MRFSYTLKSAGTALYAHKTRTALTILGITIGIASIVAVVSLGDGVQQLIVGELGGLGSESMVVRPGKEPDGPTEFADAFFSDSLKERDFRAISNHSNVPDFVSGTPEVFVSGSVTREGEIYSKSFIVGLDIQVFADVLKLELESGQLYDEQDIVGKEKSAVIGQNVKEELFGEDDPVGKSVTIEGQKFKVVGLVKPRGRLAFFNVDDLVAIPHTTAQTYITGTKHYTQIFVQASSPDNVNRMKDDITRTLRDLHNIDEGEKADFNVQTQQGLVEQVGAILASFVAFLAVVVAVALLVGGVGVMNVMLVSVTERTKEIGLRKAVGATRSNILSQFIVESIILTILGGLVGVLFGSGLAYGISVLIKLFAGMDLGFSFPYLAALVGILVSGFVGLVFGLYPAREASKLSPKVAMSYE